MNLSSSKLNQAATENFSGLKAHPSTIICRERTVILGDVVIDADCVVHPTAQIIAEKGPIEIGSNNLIEERVTIVNKRKEKMQIGSENVFEVDAYCEAPIVGSNNLFESKSRVCKRVAIGSNSIIGAGCQLVKNDADCPSDEIESLPSNKIIYGNKMVRTLDDSEPASQMKQLEFLRKVLPNYQKIYRPTT